MAPGVAIVYSFKMEGDKVTLKAQRDLNGPVASPVTVVLARVD